MPAPPTTKTREAIYSVLAEAEGPLTAVQIRMVFEEKTRPGIATVYRAVNAGVGDGVLKQVPLGDGTMRFEPANRGHHHHFVCTACERVVDVEGCPGYMESLVPDGYTLTNHELTLRGLCEACT